MGPTEGERVVGVGRRVHVGGPGGSLGDGVVGGPGGARHVDFLGIHGIVRVGDEGLAVCPVVVGADVELADDVPVLDGCECEPELLSELVFVFFGLAAVLEGVDVVDVGHQVSVGVVLGADGAGAAEDVVIEAAAHRRGPDVVGTDPASGVVGLEPVGDPGADLAGEGVALHGVVAVAHESLLVHEVAGDVVGVPLVASADADVVLLRRGGGLVVLTDPVDVGGGVVVVPLGTVESGAVL